MFLEMPLLLIISLREAARDFFWAKIIENFILSFRSPQGIFGAVNFVGSAIAHAATNAFLPLAIIGFSAGLFLILGYRLIRNFKELILVRI